MPVATKGKPLVQIIEETTPLPPVIPAPVVVVVSKAELPAPESKPDKEEKKVEKEEKKVEKDEKKIEKDEKKEEKKIEKDEKKMAKDEKKLEKAIEKEEVKKQKTIVVVAPEPVVVAEAKVAPKVVVPGERSSPTISE